MKIFTNHVGYNLNDPKQCIIRAPKDAGLSEFTLYNYESGEKVFTGPLLYTGKVAQWHDWEFWTGDFSDFKESGFFVISTGSGIPSAPFEIGERLVQDRVLKNVLYYFKTQRASGIWNEQDYEVPFYGDRKGTADVHGGYYDASGDYSKYMTHLSYANYMNPQQIPATVWIMGNAYERLLPQIKDHHERRVFEFLLNEETAWGADFLFRMQDPEGYFYTNVFDRWSKDVKQRVICSFKSIRGQRSDDYQAGYRQGAGMAIAALARASRLGISGEHTANDYIYAAERGFRHLEEHNLEYLDDGKENIIDDYCALLAAIELYGATWADEYLEAMRKRADNLKARMSEDENYSGWFRADDTGERPYFHASEAGLPLIALNYYSLVEPDKKRKKEFSELIYKSISFEMNITNEVNNPFGYPRQYVKSLKGPKRGAFFHAHENETGYWWQGENARIASLSAAAQITMELAIPYCVKHKIITQEQADKLNSKMDAYRVNQINWILGLNPFDTCFLKGSGRKALDYHWSAPGGICNGITAAIGNEEDIAFMQEGYADNPAVSWRWSEQWLPHSSWFLMALVSNYNRS